MARIRVPNFDETLAYLSRMHVRREFEKQNDVPVYASVRPSKNKVGIELIWNSTVHTRAGRVHDRCYGYTSGSSPVGACRVLNCLWKTRSSFVVTALPVILHACDITCL